MLKKFYDLNFFSLFTPEIRQDLKCLLPAQPASYARDTQQLAVQQEFTPGNIHKPEFRDYWASTLKANSWVMDLLENGYTLPFHSEPQPSETRNNLSARKHQQFVREEVIKLQQSGVVTFVAEKPFIVSPLTVASNSAGKLRLCLDVSRSVNTFLNVPKVVLADLTTALQLTDTNDWQAVYDLSSAYHHIKICKQHVRFLGAAFQKEDGTTQYFVFHFLPFGIASAVHVMTKVMKPFTAFLSGQGIKHAIYLDDGRVCSGSREQAIKDLQTIYEGLRKAGWIIAVKKSDSSDTVSQLKNYLGFQIDSRSMRVFLQPQKQQELVDIVSKLIEGGITLVKAKFLAKVLGKMISCSPALGNIPLIFARQGYFILEPAVERHGWTTNVQVTQPLLDSLKHFLVIFPQFNGQPIAHSADTISLLSIIGPPDDFFSNSFVRFHTPTLPKEVFASDASNVAVCSYSIGNKDQFFFIGQLSDSQTQTSSGHRELLAVKLALQAKLQSSGPWPQLTNIVWLTDSQNLVTFLTKGSTKPLIQETVLQVMLLVHELNINLIPMHLRREDPRIQMADAGSRVRDSDDWSIDHDSFESINSKFGPFTLDPFADCSNAKADRFFSDFICPSTLGVDAFAHSWERENLWLCPPISKIIPTLRKLKASTLFKGVLIVPTWRAASFWPILFPSSSANLPFIKNITEFSPFIIQNQRALSPLSGKPPFTFLMVQIQSM